MSDDLQPTPSPELPPDPPANPATEPVDAEGKRFIIKGFKKKVIQAGMEAEFTIEWAIFKERYPWPESWRRLQEKMGPEVLKRLEEKNAEQRDESVIRRKLIRELTKQVPIEKVAQPREIASWVANHLSMPPLEIDVDKVPSRGALEMLATASGDESTRQDFLYTQFPRMMAAKDNEKGAAGPDKPKNVENKRLRDLLQSQMRNSGSSPNGAEPEVQG